MHIGFLTPEYPHANAQGKVAGIGTSIKNLVTNFLEEGQKVTVFIYHQNEDAVYEEDGVKIVHIQNTKKNFLNWYWTRKKIEKVINKSVIEEKLDLIEAADWAGITAFMNLQCKHLLRLHGSDTYFCHLEGRKQKFKNFILEKTALKKADSIVSVSRFTADMTQKLFNIHRDINVIHNGIDLNNFTLVEQTHSHEKTLLYFGTLIRKKGVLELPLIMKELSKEHKDTKLILVGNDAIDVLEGVSTWQLMQEACDAQTLKMIEYKGPVPYTQMKEEILKAGLCVFPSYAEAFPVAWLEAMACKKPVVASNIGWASESIKHGVSGLLCSPNNHKEYAQLISSVLSDEQYSLLLGINARKRIEAYFSAKDIALQNLEYYTHVMSKA